METSILIDREGTDRLEAFLISDRAPERAMMLDELDGFVTATICSNQSVPFEEWLAEIWGGEEPAYADDAEALEIVNLILRLSRLVLVLLASDDESYRPIYADDAPFSTVSAWARGFMRALTMAAEVWDPLVRERQELIMPLVAAAVVVVNSKESEVLRSMMEDEQMQKEIREAIPGCVEAIYEFWHKREVGDDRPYFRGTAKTGRNEPCPCGSGNKYKKCCGSR